MALAVPPGVVIVPQPFVAVLLQLSVQVTAIGVVVVHGKTVHELALTSCVPPAGTVALVGVITIVVPKTMVKVAVAVLVGSAWETAVISTCAGLGTVGGAVYRPVEEIVPRVALPPIMGAVGVPPGLPTSHVTAVFAVVLKEVENWSVRPV